MTVLSLPSVKQQSFSSGGITFYRLSGVQLSLQPCLVLHTLFLNLLKWSVAQQRSFLSCQVLMFTFVDQVTLLEKSDNYVSPSITGKSEIDNTIKACLTFSKRWLHIFIFPSILLKSLMCQ